jgi:acyl-CoA thioesterase
MLMTLDYSPYPHSKRCRQWIKATGRISDTGGHEAHLAALAYMSDNYFIGTVSRVHKLWRIPARVDEHKELKVDEDVRKVLRVGDDTPKAAKPDAPKPPVVSMMVSLDHSIYFHDVKGFRSDDWIFAEMESPWAGDGRGLVIQRMYTKEGKLIASCVQEVRSFKVLINLTFLRELSD